MNRRLLSTAAGIFLLLSPLAPAFAGQPVTQQDSAGGDATDPTNHAVKVIVVTAPSVAQSGSWSLNNISGTISLPTGAATSANQTSGVQKTQIVDGSGNVIGSLGNALNMNIASGSLTVAGTLNALLQAQSSHSINTGGVEGVSASGSAFSDSPIGDGCRAALTSPTAVTDGQKVAVRCTATGKQIVDTLGDGNFAVFGTVATTGNTAVTVIAAQGAGITMRITRLQCWRTDTATTAQEVTLNDAVPTVEPIPPQTSGVIIDFNPPIPIAANTAFTIQPTNAITSTKCSAQGFKGG